MASAIFLPLSAGIEPERDIGKIVKACNMSKGADDLQLISLPWKSYLVEINSSLAVAGLQVCVVEITKKYTLCTML